MTKLQIPYGFIPPEKKSTLPPADTTPPPTTTDPENSHNDTTETPSNPESQSEPTHNQPQAASKVEGLVVHELDEIAHEAMRRYVELMEGEGQSGVVVMAAEVIRGAGVSFGEGECVPEAIMKAICMIWDDPGVQYCFSRSNEYQLMDSCP